MVGVEGFRSIVAGVCQRIAVRLALAGQLHLVIGRQVGNRLAVIIIETRHETKGNQRY